jgi:hypothetical protein
MMVVAFLDIFGLHVPKEFSEIMLLIIALTSLTLSYIMVNFKNKRLLDTALTLREIAIMLVVSRILYTYATGWYDVTLSSLLFLFLAASGLFTLIAIFRTTYKIVPIEED